MVKSLGVSNPEITYGGDLKSSDEDKFVWLALLVLFYFKGTKENGWVGTTWKLWALCP
jgi:hypothetical protein